MAGHVPVRRAKLFVGMQAEPVQPHWHDATTAQPPSLVLLKLRCCTSTPLLYPAVASNLKPYSLYYTESLNCRTEQLWQWIGITAPDIIPATPSTHPYTVIPLSPSSAVLASM